MSASKLRKKVKGKQFLDLLKTREAELRNKKSKVGPVEVNDYIMTVLDKLKVELEVLPHNEVASAFFAVAYCLGEAGLQFSSEETRFPMFKKVVDGVWSGLVSKGLDDKDKKEGYLTLSRSLGESFTFAHAEDIFQKNAEEGNKVVGEHMKVCSQLIADTVQETINNIQKNIKEQKE